MATMSARYTVLDGEVIAQERGGVRHQLVPDPLGSTVALFDDSGNKTDTFQYWPYGESAGRTGTTSTPFKYVGSFGYYQDGSARNYVRARYLDKGKGRWITEDPIGFGGGDVNLFRYCGNNPIKYIDPTGLSLLPIGSLVLIGLIGACIGGAFFIGKRYNDNGEDRMGHCMFNCMGARCLGGLGIIVGAPGGLPGMVSGGIIGIGVIGIIDIIKEGKDLFESWWDNGDMAANITGLGCALSIQKSSCEDCCRERLCLGGIPFKGSLPPPSKKPKGRWWPPMIKF